MTEKDNDLEKVNKALRSEKEKSLFKKELSPLVDAVVGLYLDYGSTKEELRDISWIYLDFAMKKYVERMEKEKPDKEKYKFSTYFSWYIKTSIETYLGISEEPLKNIPIRDRRGSPAETSE